MGHGLLLAPALLLSSAGPAFELSWKVDPPILLIGGGVIASFLVLDEAPGVHCAPVCDRAKVNAFDRIAAGNYDETWNVVGDISTAAVLLYGPVMLVLGEGLANGLNDTLVAGEAALLSSAIQVGVSYAVARPRPRAYGTEAPLEDRSDANAARSFFSGHVANGVAAAVATAIAFHRLEKPELMWAALIGGVLGSSMVGVARIGAGAHFPTDVLFGAMIGAGAGIAIPALHDAGVQIAPVALAGEDARGVALSGRF